MITKVLVSASCGFWDRDFESNTFFANEEFCDFLGINRTDLPDLESLETLLHPDDRIQFKNAIEDHYRNPDSSSVNLNLRYRHKSGKWISTYFRGRVIDRDPQGKPLRFIGDHVDLTRLTNTEEELRHRNESLELLSEGINAGIWEWDVASGKTIWSPRLFEILGYQPYEMETSYDLFMNEMIHPDHVEGLKKNLDDYLNHKSPYQTEFKCLCRNGEYRWFETHGAARFDSDGNAIRMIGSLLDINDRKQLEERSLRSIDILTSSNQRLLNFAYIVSHNLRSHSANMLSLLEIFQDVTEEQKAEIFNHLKNNASKLLETIDSLADVVKIQTELDKKRELLSLAAVTDRVLHGLSEAIRKTGIEITTDFSEIPEVKCIPAYLESILHNLVSNAIKYRDPDKNAVCSLVTRKSSKGCMLICSDNGQGIDLVQHREQLYGLYKTFHGNPDAKGVGLFLIKNQIESLGGTIEIESKIDEGTTFTITLP
jgi:PAS domain S-box-containing protein